MADIRIKDLPEALDIEEADYVAVDNAGDGTRRFRLGSLRDETSIAQSFVITVSHTPGSATSYSSDKTFAEITSAISEGRIPTLKLGETYCVLLEASETGIVFMRNAVDYKSSIVIAPDDSVTLMNYEMTSSDIPNESAVQASTVTGAFNVLSYSVNSLSSGVTDANNAIASLDGRVTALESGQGGGGGGSGSGLTDDIKTALLQIAEKVAYVDASGQSYYDELYDALYTSTTRSVLLVLSHVSSTNSASTVEIGDSYQTILTPSTNYTMNTVTVTMGGVDVTATAYSSGTVSIPSVTGNIVITASAVLAAQSITATYTQSGTVYETDTLDSLKPDLVVTANYSVGTSETVPASDYTLSGTLTVGTSTITVSYAGLTTTFNVTVTEWQPITVTLTWTGSGTDKKTNLIDATEYDAYFTLPFVSGSQNLVAGATVESLGCKEYVEIYDDSAGTHRIGYYYTDTKQIESGRTTVNSPFVPFETEEIFVPKGYYGKIVLSRVNTDAWPDNSNFLQYLNANATEAVMR